MKLILNYLFNLVVMIRGASTVTLMPFRHNSSGELTALSIYGYAITVYCKKYIYKVDYSTGLWCTKKVVCYELYSVCTDDAPADLKEITEHSVFLPDITPSFVRWGVKRKVLVNAYLNILVARSKAK